MRRPKQIVVMGRRIALKLESAQLNTVARGVHVSHENVIVLDASNAPDEMRAVCLHELLHDIDQCCGAGLSEQSVASLASVLFQVIRDNPQLVSWLQEREDVG